MSRPVNKKQPYTLNLKKFNLGEIKDDAVCVLIGKRRSGKSFCIRDLLYHNNDVPYGIVISGSEEANPFFDTIVPKSFIFSDFDETILDSLTTRQKKRLKMDKRMGRKRDNRCFLVIDDCMHDSHWIRTRSIKNLFMNGRHFKFFFIMGMQYMMGLTPDLRTNIDYVFIFNDPILSNRKKIYDHYAGMFPDLGSFCQVMDSLNEFECLVINNVTKSSKIDDQVFWFKASSRESFQMGCKEYWDYHYENYQTDSEERALDTYKPVNNGKRGPLQINKLN